MTTPLIQLQGLHKHFGGNHVLRGVDLSIFRGEIMTVIGKSGGGKSVLLKHIIGLLEPDAGDILFEGEPIRKMRRFRRRGIKKKFSYMFQGSALFDSMTVFDNIALPLKEKTSLSDRQITGKVHDIIRQLDLFEVDALFPSQLSGGMRKRVALARALITDPEIVLFDEPTTGLDPIRKNSVHSMITEYQQQFGFTGVLVSHEIPDVFYISQRIAMLDKGRILFQGTPEEIHWIDNPEVQQFIRGIEPHRDSMTGLASQAEGERRFRQEMSRMERYGITFSLVLFTFENLEEIIQDLGHDVGLELLRNFVVQIQHHLRITDSCSHYGVNKALLLLPEINLNHARAICERLAAEIQKVELIDRARIKKGFCFRISAGYAEVKSGDKLEGLVTTAEANQNQFFDFSVC